MDPSSVPLPTKPDRNDFNITVVTDDAEISFRCPTDMAVLIAMERAGLALVPVGCRGGGCGVCTIAVEEGDFSCGKMSCGHVSEEEQRTGSKLLACKTFPTSDLRVRPDGRLFKKLRKHATVLAASENSNPTIQNKGGQ